ncbi:MAG: hypothetical protein MI757_20650, partial [Pirellulales bacterium]|nr:hypothetical protein [Pirellulales bacterium]
MNESNTRRITAEEAAQLIYGKTTPSEEQVASVVKMLVYGALDGHQAGPVKKTWYTTTGAVAELMARRSLNKTTKESHAGVSKEICECANSAIRSAHFSQKDEDELKGAY